MPYIKNGHHVLPKLLIDKTRFLYDDLYKYASSFYPEGRYTGYLSWIVEIPYQVHLYDCNNPLSLKMREALYGLSLEKRIETRARISKRTKEIFPHMKAKHVFDAYYQDKQFCFASDIARHNIIYLYGGIYADIGVSFLHDLTPYADAYDYMFTAVTYGFIDQSFFGYKKNDPLIKEYLEVINTLYKLPQKAKDISKRAWEKQGWVGCSLIMACIDQFSRPQEDRFLFVPEGSDSLITINHAGSWLGFEKAGNTTVFNSPLDILSITP